MGNHPSRKDSSETQHILSMAELFSGGNWLGQDEAPYGWGNETRYGGTWYKGDRHSAAGGRKAFV
jgi:hypothetical protein